MSIPTNPSSGSSESYEMDPGLIPDISNIEIDDGKPVDNIYSERQMRLLVAPLYDSWKGPGEGKPFVAFANVGIFFALKKPPIVPDVLLSLDVLPGGDDPTLKDNLTYFVWVMGKVPEAVIEVVSNRKGGELEEKKEQYCRLRIPYYIVWDPKQHLGRRPLHCFALNGASYAETEPWFPILELGVTVWDGLYQGVAGPWLRWCDARGKVLPLAAENAAALAAKLRALGLDPDQI